MSDDPETDDVRPEYDEDLFRHGIRGKYANRYAAGTNVVRIAPDVAKHFPNADAVNAALRRLIARENGASSP